MEYVARLFTDGGFQAIADARNAECGSSIVTWHPPAAERRNARPIPRDQGQLRQ
jgi:hypothetical protein